ncbi:MAG: wax ester/triacylglycerol synthase family O-acyltransferase [Pseudomonadota bacterium]
MSKLSLLDLAFFVAETEASPKHVAGLLIFKRPPKSKATFARELYKEFLTHTEACAPFNQVVRFNGMPHWETCTDFDLEKHVFYHKLAAGKNERHDLYAFVAALHEPLLDRSRPMWEVHVIDGLRGGQYAVYQKVHHAVADGVTLTRWTADGLDKTAGDTDLRPMWTIRHGRGGGLRQREVKMETLQVAWQSVSGASKHFLGIGRLAAMLLLEGMKLTKNAIALPFATSSHTPLTGQVTSGRQFASASVALERIDQIRASTRSTLNHVALTCLDGALHRYLKDQNVALERPITIQMPVNLRQEGDKSAGNKIGIVQVELSAPTDDPYIRLRNIGFSLRNVRSMIDSVAPEAIASYTLMTGLAGQLIEMLKLSDRLPPLGNTLVSNVPGPKSHLYLKGARLEELHPISTLPPSNLLNITLFSYAGNLYFGLIATAELPNLDKLSEYVGEAFTELEETIRVVGQ